MALLPDMSDLFGSSPLASLSFNYSDLQVLISALYYYQRYIDSVSHDNKYETCDDGRSEFDVVSGLLEKFVHYNFK